jgi:uncharacterized protein YmfQ (DUF2313 family)
LYGNTNYGINLYGQEIVSKEIPEADKINLLKLLPPVLQEVREIKEIEDVYSVELWKVGYFARSCLKQRYVNDSTWGLEFWEKELGIKTDISKSYEFRRENIIAKLRGAGTVTKGMIKNVVRTFTNSEAEIIEYPNEYRFVIKFIGVFGIPNNMAGLIEAIELLKPAHLIYSFEYKYTVWSFLKDASLNWSTSKLKTWNELKSYE